jgi:hypothetical protein
MHLIHLATAKNSSGIYDISVLIVNSPESIKKYDYQIPSEYHVRKFERYYHKGRGFHGVALKTLNENKIKKENIYATQTTNGLS